MGALTAVVLAAAAAWFVVPSLPARSRVRPRRGVPVGTAYAVAAITSVVLIGGVLGPAAGTVTTAVAIVVAGVGNVVVGSLRERARERLADDVARACSALAQELSIGRVPATALAAAADDFPVLVPAASIARVGGDVVTVWTRERRTPGAEGLGRVARAWSLAETTGAPLADTLEAVAVRLRADREVAGVVNAELAAARMTGRLLTALPAAGMLIGYGIGGDPLGFLVGNPIGQACLVLGTALAMGGLWWTERLGR